MKDKTTLHFSHNAMKPKSGFSILQSQFYNCIFDALLQIEDQSNYIPHKKVLPFHMYFEHQSILC